MENASRQVLADGMSLARIMQGLRDHQGFFNAGLVLMGYMNPFLQYGFEKLAKECEEVGVSGMIIPDLPYEEAAPYRETLKKHGVALIALVGPNTSEERHEALRRCERRLYLRGLCHGRYGRAFQRGSAVVSTMERARRCFRQPLALGFGLSHPEQLQILPDSAQPDAAVFGSALLKHLAAGLPRLRIHGPLDR